MIVEEREYALQPGTVKPWLDFYEKSGWPLQQKYLGRCIGFFQTEIGELHHIVHLWAYDDVAHRERARAEMAKDPEWQKFVHGQPPGMISQVVRIMTPVSFSPLK